MSGKKMGYNKKEKKLQKGVDKKMKMWYYADNESDKNFIVQFKFFKRKLAVLQSCSLAVLQSCSLAVLQSCSLAVLQSCSLAVLQSCSLAVLLKFCLKDKINSNTTYRFQKTITYILILFLVLLTRISFPYYTQSRKLFCGGSV